MGKRLVFWLKSSRPGLWFPTLWLYLLPLGGGAPYSNWKFWLGLGFAALPLNLVVYGWNDLVDADTDRINPRKDSWLFGAAGSDQELASLPGLLLVTSALSVSVFTWIGGAQMLIGFATLGLILWAYNYPGQGLRGRPPWELFCQGGYLLVVPFSTLLNGAAWLPLPTWFYLVLFALQSHLMGEVMDIEPDREAGRKTTATQLGPIRTKLVIMAIVATEAALLIWLYRDYVFGGMLVLAWLWLVLDLTWVFGGRAYTLGQMRLFGVGANLLALGSMAYVWWSGCLLSLPGRLE